MPYVEILAPPASSQSKAALAKSVTESLMSTFSVGPETVTLYFLPIIPEDYAHAGEMGTGASQRILLKIHAFRRGVTERRAAASALTRSVTTAYGVPSDDVAVYFLDRDKDEVAHAGKLASD